MFYFTIKSTVFHIYFFTNIIFISCSETKHLLISTKQGNKSMSQIQTKVCIDMKNMFLTLALWREIKDTYVLLLCVFSKWKLKNKHTYIILVWTSFWNIPKTSTLNAIRLDRQIKSWGARKPNNLQSWGARKPNNLRSWGARKPNNLQS